MEAIRSTVKYLRLRILQGVNFRAESAAPTHGGTLCKVAHWRGLPSCACKPATSFGLQAGVLTRSALIIAQSILLFLSILALLTLLKGHHHLLLFKHKLLTVNVIIHLVLLRGQLIFLCFIG